MITFFTCVDQKNGICFNDRPVSSDAVIWEDLYKEAFHFQKGIEMDYRDIVKAKNYYEFHPRATYEDYIFQNFLKPNHVEDDEDFPDYEYDYEYGLFFEYESGARLGFTAERVVLYRWDKTYPADVELQIPLEEYELVSETRMVGSSHELIVKEEYIRKDILNANEN